MAKRSECKRKRAACDQVVEIRDRKTGELLGTVEYHRRGKELTIHGPATWQFRIRKADANQQGA